MWRHLCPSASGHDNLSPLREKSDSSMTRPCRDLILRRNLLNCWKSLAGLENAVPNGRLEVSCNLLVGVGGSLSRRRR